VRALAAVTDFVSRQYVRIGLALAAVLLLLAAVKLVNWFGPVGAGLVAGPLITAILIVLARRAGLSWDDLGLSRRAVRRGALWAAAAVAVVAVVLLAGVAIPWFRSAFFDVRYQLDADSALITALLVIPLRTVLLEEVAFRGVLFGLLHKRRRTVWAFAVSSGLFGLWHILPYLHTEAPFGTIAAIVGITAALGLVLCELRRRSGSLLASIVGHWAGNGLGVLLAALLWSWT
jgi:membrane protease YdiL (CAAX protease family)